ncbi:molybdopterin-dependent oxidoreductase [Actimicrobium sp. CCC2.4]|uniref:nitrate reductase n=1 Tax=Actimicrobium sp. CCC2.4 TaxID=3048606 RepID=UPI002AC91C63|nr:molybdopterin-dependent oxidoreductase [Actimicrobium sp. CCC2.4]MEB0137041.1 molybdopterin-dependent oxidoreductase [Actimicrobium sp. CCC2.4]WPX32222.1 molybdopterin-dependent oxidoreductase [Actimicrobium sp. CCC2.4]
MSEPLIAGERREIKSTCCYCGVGCGVLIETTGTQITGVRGDPDHPANFGRLCTKGSTLALSAQPLLQQQARALVPEMRSDRSLPRTAASWDATLDAMAQKFADTIRTHGPDSVGFYISGQLLTEDYYVFNKLAKGLIGTNNVDTNSRLCMSSAVAGYKQTLGADAPPACYEDIEQAELVFIVGSNMAYAHPILYRRLEEARKNNPQMKVIVADPRRTDTARDADLFLQILPGTDVALFNGMLHLCLWEELTDTAFIEAHTDGFAELKRTVRDYTPKFVADICGISEADLVTAARWFGESKAALSLYCQGLNQSASGTAKNAALINLHLATHQIGKPGAGPFSLTGQPNAMGGREVGGMANLLSAHRDLGNPVHRAEVASLWGVDDVPATPGKTAIDLFEAVRTGQIKLLWIACTNPAQSMPDQKLVREALVNAELVILQEAYATTATAPYADVLLPATSWGEKEGTVTNSERRISRLNAAIAGPGEARHDWQIVVDFAQRLEKLLGRERSLFAYDSAESIWNEHRESTRGRDLDITGLSYAILAEQGPQQWPYPTGATTGKQRLYEDGIFPTATGRAHFVDTPYKPVAEAIDARFPFRLNTGRLRDQWHGMSRTGTVAQLFAHAAEPAIVMAQADMDRRMIAGGDMVHVTSRRGSQIFPVHAGDDMRAGQAFIGMHWGEEYVSGRGHAGDGSHGVNALTSPALDPSSKQPELKHAAIKILKAELPWRFVVFGWIAPQQVLRLQSALKPYLRQFAYASCTLFGRERTGVFFRAADDYPATPELIAEIEALFGITGPMVLRYDDKRRGNARHIVVSDGTLQALSLAGDVAAERWLREYLETEQPVAALGRLLLQPSAVAPQGFKSRGRIVCNCFNVAETEINELLGELDGPPDARLAALQGRLKCGTNCGSCLPELKKIIAILPVGAIASV